MIMGLEFLLATILLVGSWSLTNSMSKEEFHILYMRPDLHKDLIEKMHFGIYPEFVEHLRLLVRLDRHTLKIILENQAALFEGLLVSMVIDAYNVSTPAGYCATQEERAHRKRILDQKTKIESIIDKTLDAMHEKWGKLQTQDDLEAYFLVYWEDRNALYNYATHRYSGRNCNESEMMNRQCTAVESLQACFNKAAEAMARCR